MKTEKEILIQIDSYIKGNLSQEEIDKLWIQFLQNPAYFEWFETELHLRYLIKKNQIQKDEQSGDQTGKFFFMKYKSWALAAAAILLITVAIQFFVTSEQDLVRELAVAEISKQELVGADILRSEEQQVDPVDVSMNEGLASALEGNEERAIEIFEKILSESTQNRQMARAEMNLGILKYNQEKYDEAAIHFRNVTEMNTMSKFFEEKAWWFSGNAYLNLNRLEEAREAIQNTYSLDGRYKDAALDLLSQLDMQLELNSQN